MSAPRVSDERFDALTWTRLLNNAEKWEREMPGVTPTLFDRLVLEVRDARARCERLEAAKNDAYSQRNRLAVLLATMFGGRIVPAEPKEPGWSSVLIFDLPTGQVSFHLHDSEMAAAMACPKIKAAENDWDGHDDATKWERIWRAALAGDGHGEVRDGE